MQTLRRNINPFALMLDPQAVIAQIERSERLEGLNRRICRPLDKPLLGGSAEVADEAANEAVNESAHESANGPEMPDGPDAVDSRLADPVDVAAAQAGGVSEGLHADAALVLRQGE